MGQLKENLLSGVFCLFCLLAVTGCDEFKSTKAIFEEARSSVAKGDPTGAITGFTEVIERDPDFYSAYADRAMAERELKQYDKAISDCDRAIEIKPNYYFAFVERGLSEAGLGNPENAIGDYLHAARLEPTNAYAFYEMGMADCQLSHFNEAIACLTHAIELDDNSGRAYISRSLCYNNRGWAEFLKGDFRSSITDATRSIQLDPNLGYGYGTRGWARYKVGDVPGAAEDCKRAVQLCPPGSAPFFCDQGMIDFIARDYTKAMGDWQNAIEQQPNLKRELLPWIKKAQGIAGSKASNSSED